MSGDQFNGVFGDIEGCELRGNVVVLEHFDSEDDWRQVLLEKHVDDWSS